MYSRVIHRVIPLAKERFFLPNGDLPPSFVRLQRLLDALMRTGLRIACAANKFFLFVVDGKAKQNFG